MDHHYLPAPLWRRFIAALLDVCFLFVLTLWITFVVHLVADAFQLLGEYSRADRIFGIFILFSIAGYFVHYWGNAGATPAEKLMKLSVLSENGEKIRSQEAFFRFLGLLIYGVGTLGFGFLRALFHPKKQTLYDKYSKTIVVFAKKY